MQTAFYIDNVSSSATFDQGEGEESSLSVTFDIFNRGPNHIAGLFVTTDYWSTWQIVHAQFEAFIDNANGESWSASFSVPGPKVPAFEFVVFCDDLGGVDSVPRIWNTNAGSVFQVSPAEL